VLEKHQITVEQLDEITHLMGTYRRDESFHSELCKKLNILWIDECPRYRFNEAREHCTQLVETYNKKLTQ
jgi:hypothetical protein